MKIDFFFPFSPLILFFTFYSSSSSLFQVLFLFLLSTATKTHQSLNLLCSHVTFFSSFEGLYARIWQVKKNNPFILIWLLYLSELFLNHFFYFTFFPFIVLVLYFNCSSIIVSFCSSSVISPFVLSCCFLFFSHCCTFFYLHVPFYAVSVLLCSRGIFVTALPILHCLC